jgi:hypothetical protein
MAPLQDELESAAAYAMHMVLVCQPMSAETVASLRGTAETEYHNLDIHCEIQQAGGRRL